MNWVVVGGKLVEIGGDVCVFVVFLWYDEYL